MTHSEGGHPPPHPTLSKINLLERHKDDTSFTEVTVGCLWEKIILEFFFANTLLML